MSEHFCFEDQTSELECWANQRAKPYLFLPAWAFFVSKIKYFTFCGLILFFVVYFVVGHNHVFIIIIIIIVIIKIWSKGWDVGLREHCSNMKEGLGSIPVPQKYVNV